MRSSGLVQQSVEQLRHSVSERRLWEKKAHQTRELVARLDGLPGRGIKG